MDLELLQPGRPRPGARSIHHVGAWCGSFGLREPRRAAEAAAALGLDALVLPLNHFAEVREPIPWSTRDVGSLAALAQETQAKGLEVHLATWLVADEGFVDAAVGSVADLVTTLDARSLVLIVDNPWFAGAREGDTSALEDRLVGGLAAVPCPIGMTSHSILPSGARELAVRVDFLVPEALSTTTSGLAVGSGQRACLASWREVAPAPVVTLAAGRQRGLRRDVLSTDDDAATYGVEEALRTAFLAADDEGVTAVWYRALRHIVEDAEVAAFLHNVRG